MPEVFPRRVADRSVREALYLARAEFLPAPIRENENATWILGFDELQKRSFEQPFYDRPNESENWPLNFVVISSLQQRIPYLFGALFHIGRQWKVSESALGALGRASERKNLVDSVGLTLESLREFANTETGVARLYEQDSKETAEALSWIFSASLDQHAGRLREAQHWWNLWSDEVGTLRKQMDRLQEAGFRAPDYRLWREVARFIAEGYRPSLLRATLESAGVRFVNARERSISEWPLAYSEMLTPLLLLSLTSKGGEPFFHDFMFEWRHILHDFWRQAEYGESRRVALERLIRKYRHEEEDPFKSYLPLGKPATEELRNLVIEHTLPGNQTSPWLTAWKQCVEYDSTTALPVPLKDLKDWQVLSGFARGADSAIKSELPGDYLPGESWNDFVQRLFESAWVSSIADQIVDKLKAKSGSKWSLDSFVNLVEGVAGVLNKFGYKIKAPSVDRLKKLWERLLSDEPYSDDKW
jgi:hypothetical protein